MIGPLKFVTNHKLIFGDNSLNQLPGAVREILNKDRPTVLIVRGNASFKESPYWEQFAKGLEEEYIAFFEYEVPGEPTPELIDEAVNICRNEQVDGVISIGGGSVMDTGKAVSAMITEDGTVEDYLEGIGDRKPSGKKVPFFAVPTTAGTGSEATKNAVVRRVGDDGYKKSLRHENYIPDIALIDPVLTLACPYKITVACGLDAFTQLLESYISTKASPITDSLAESGLKYFAKSFSRAVEDGSNIEARTGMAYAAYLSGVTLANAGLGTVHGLAGVLGGKYNIPHGIACGTLIAPVYHRTVRALQSDSTANRNSLKKFALAGLYLNGEFDVCPENGDIDKYCDLLLKKLFKWAGSLKIPDLSKFGVKKADLRGIAEMASNKNNPVQFDTDELEEILRERL